MNIKVELYTQPNCRPCAAVQQFLEAHQVEYTSYNIKQDKDAKNRLMFKHESYSTPTLIVGDTVICGYNIEKLEKVFKRYT